MNTTPALGQERNKDTRSYMQARNKDMISYKQAHNNDHRQEEFLIMQQFSKLCRNFFCPDNVALYRQNKYFLNDA